MTHTSEIGKLIRITASAKQAPDHPSIFDHADDQTIYSYTIRIENLSKGPVQLLRRYWQITDALHGSHVVEGEGVVGEQPVLNPGDHYSYNSWCPLQGEHGSMKGHYTFISLETKDRFYVEIPEFVLQPEYSLN